MATAAADEARMPARLYRPKIVLYQAASMVMIQSKAPRQAVIANVTRKPAAQRFVAAVVSTGPPASWASDHRRRRAVNSVQTARITDIRATKNVGVRKDA